MTREEQLACLKDRPCDVCKMRTDKGCSSWECVFEQTPDEEKEPCEDCISRQGAIDALGYNISITSDEGLDEYRTVLKEMLGKIYDTQKAQIEALPSIQPTAKENLVVEDCISRKEALDLVEDMTDQFGVGHRVITEGVISMLPPVTPKPKTDALDKIRAEIEQVKSIMNEEIINHDRKDLINFVNGLNQSLTIIDKYKTETELETWEGIHAQVTAPKGAFDKIWNEAKEDNDEI